MKKILFALLLVFNSLQAETALMSLGCESHQHTNECNCQDHCACHDTAHKFSPIGVMGSHLHKQGEVMFSYRFKFMEMEGLRKGSDRVSHLDHVGNPNTMPGRFMALPRRMTMKMHMLGMMYGVTDDFTLGIMIPWMESAMDIKMANGNKFSTRTDGFGDIKLNGLLRLWSNEHNNLILNLGISLPTGTINEYGNTPMRPNGTRLPYPMQLGSGTVDFMPGLTFTGHNEDWGWGAQVIATLRMHRNYRGYNKGNSLLFNSWISRKITKNFATSLRIEVNSWDDYEGHDDQINAMRLMMPTANNDLRGGTRVDAHIGFNYLFTEGFLKGSNIGVEVGIPVYQYLEGPNLETDLVATIGWQKTF